VALIVYVTVAEYDPVLYVGSFVNDQTVEAELPALAELAPAPNVATLVEALVLDVWEPLQAVAGAAAVQVYDKASPAVGGVVTEGPPAGLKSDVTFSVTLPVPVDCVVRIL
jgi:hypothetical protein